MSQRWWPGLEQQVNTNAHAEQDREDRRYVDSGWRLPRWLVARSATPYWISVGLGLLGGLIGTGLMAATGWLPAMGGFFGGILIVRLLVEAWYGIGARRLRRESAPGPTPD